MCVRGLISVSLALLLAGMTDTAVSADRSDGRSAIQAKPFAPGVRIDWTNRRVELEAKIVLRQGALELVACSPQTREHESIVVVSAKPLDIYHAMGLVGLEPGQPIHFDKKRQQWIEPTGQALDIRVRFRKDSRRVVWPIERWLVRNDTGRPPQPIPWVFAGSHRVEGGRLAADFEGTLICVVDFPSALIAVDTRHSADDRLLWLKANTEVIPPLDTECTLLIGERLTLPLRLVVDFDGTLTLGSRVLSVDEVVSTVKSLMQAESGVVVVLTPKNVDAAQRIPQAKLALTQAGLWEKGVKVQGVSAKRPDGKPIP